jgi:hypothetical protein
MAYSPAHSRFIEEVERPQRGARSWRTRERWLEA